MGRIFGWLFISAAQLSAQPNPTRGDIKALQDDIHNLSETLRSIQKELQEIKSLLPGRALPPNLPPTNLTLSADDDPFKGDGSAKLTLIEFSDYQCPFCGRHFRETLPQIEREYISTGKLKYVLRDFPLEAIHRQALKPAEAANCAGEQGKCWEMHNRIFQNQNQLGAEDLLRHARAIGLERSTFEQCLNSGKQAAEVRKDFADGRAAGVRGTPAFFLGIAEPGPKIGLDIYPSYGLCIFRDRMRLDRLKPVVNVCRCRLTRYEFKTRMRRRDFSFPLLLDKATHS